MLFDQQRRIARWRLFLNHSQSVLNALKVITWILRLENVSQHALLHNLKNFFPEESVINAMKNVFRAMVLQIIIARFARMRNIILMVAVLKNALMMEVVCS